MEPRLQLSVPQPLPWKWHFLWMVILTGAIMGCKSSKETTVAGGDQSATQKRIPTANILQVFDDPELELELDSGDTKTTTNQITYSGESGAFVPGNIWITGDAVEGKFISLLFETKYPDDSEKGRRAMKAIIGVANAVDLAIAPWIQEQIRQHQAMPKVPVEQSDRIAESRPTVEISKEFAAATVTLWLSNRFGLTIK